MDSVMSSYSRNIVQGLNAYHDTKKIIDKLIHIIYILWDILIKELPWKDTFSVMKMEEERVQSSFWKNLY